MAEAMASTQSDSILVAQLGEVWAEQRGWNSKGKMEGVEVPVKGFRWSGLILRLFL